MFPTRLMRPRLSAAFAVMVLAGCGAGGSVAPATAESAARNAPPPAPTNPTDPTDPSNPHTEPPATGSVVKALGLYSAGVHNLYPDPDLRIQHLFNVANDVLETSGVALAFELAHLEQVAYPDEPGVEAALEAVTLGTDPVFASVAQLRDAVQADVVVLFRPYTTDGMCGYAWIGGYQTDGDFSNPAEADFAYSTVAVDCSDYTLLHELGHNLGLAHSRLEDPDGGSLRYGAGHGSANDFVTIMATPSEFNAVRLPLLASPVLTCNGSPCGVPANDDVNGADAVAALSISKDQVAGYR